MMDLMSETARSPKQSMGMRRYDPIPWVVGMGLLVVGILLYSLFIGTRMVQRYALLIEATMEIKLELATGHLWFEEAISGDRNTDIATIWEHLDQSAWYARAMLEGGENSEGVFIPLHEPELRGKIEDVLAKILDFRAISEERWIVASGAGIGSDIDQHFDVVFEDLLRQTDDVETELQTAMAKDQHRFRIIAGLLIAICGILTVLIGIILLYYERQRTLDTSMLYESEERFRMICENAPVLINGFDENGRCVFWNKQCREIFGWTIDEINAHDSPLALFYPDPAVCAEVLMSLASDSDGNFQEWHPLTKEGRVLTTSWANFRLPGGMVFSLGHETTERKQIELERETHRKHLANLVSVRSSQLDERISESEELNSAMANVMEDMRYGNVKLEATGRALMASNKELESFSYSVSHDLRAPLRHVDGFVKLLLKHEQGNLDAATVHYLDVIATSATQMGHLIDDLLDFSRTGRTAVNLQEVDSNALVQEVQQELSPPTTDRRITWKIDDLPVVMADRGLIRQVWGNLMGNAIKYSGQCEKACIEIGMTRDHIGAEEITFFIRDNGAGFDPQYTHKLFGVFQRLHSEDEFEGTGIGLAIVRRIVHRHGGRVWAEGKVGDGATFYFTLNTKRGEV